MQQGATLIKDGICSLSLNGALNIWREALNLSEESLPSEVAIGHQVILFLVLFYNIIGSG